MSNRLFSFHELCLALPFPRWGFLYRKWVISGKLKDLFGNVYETMYFYIIKQKHNTMTNEKGIETKMYKGIEVKHIYSPSNKGFGWFEFTINGVTYRPGSWKNATKRIAQLLKNA